MEARWPRRYVKKDSQPRRSKGLLRFRIFTFILTLMPVLRRAKEGADQAIWSVWSIPERADIRCCSGPRERQTITAYSAPEAEIVAMSEGVMTAHLTYDALTFLGVSAGITPQLKIATRTVMD